MVVTSNNYHFGFERMPVPGYSVDPVLIACKLAQKYMRVDALAIHHTIKLHNTISVGLNSI
jgi:hypothetical protein